MQLLEKHLAKFGMQLGLERIEKIMSALGNPQDNLLVILVAGTNGKGSVTAYLSSILQAAGYKVGSYYSPHLVRHNERLQINGKQISDKEFNKYEKMLLQRYKQGQEMTFFEALTAIAYKYFSDKNCQFAVMEVGLGGRLDATNIANEEISIITSIGLDHTKELGSSLEQIAYEKAGILKSKNSIGIVGNVEDVKAKAKIKSEAAKRNVKLKVFGENFTCKLLEANSEKTSFNYLGNHTYKNLQARLLGSYQSVNASLAVAAAEELRIKGAHIRKGLQAAKIPGRMQILSRKPLIIVDGAHNPHAMKELVKNLHIFNYNNLIVLFAALHDKDWKSMLDMLAPKAKLVIVTEVSNERAEKAIKLAEYASKYTITKTIPNSKKAFSYASSQTGKDDVLLVCGSLYLAGEIINLF